MKLPKIFIINLLWLTIVVTYMTSPAIVHAQSTYNELESIVKNLPRNSLGLPAYWFEMNSLIGWEKMMLIFGYANNRSVCNHMLKLANIDAPNREFRCVKAN